MSVVSEFIVYLWLLPVAAQIILPLAMLMVWSINKAFGKTAASKNEALEDQEVDANFSNDTVKTVA